MQSEAFPLKFGTERHKNIVEALRARINASDRAQSTRRGKWKDAEEQFIAYLPESEADAIRRDKRRSGETEYTTLVIPYSYATLLTAHSYWSTVFLSRSPVFQFEGTKGDTESRTLAVESIVNYQCKVGEMMVPLYNWLFHPGKYGVGILGLEWDEDYEYVSRVEEFEPTILNGRVKIPGAKKQKRMVREKIRSYYGNRIFNIRPQDFVFDPRVAIGNIQRGEYAGYKTTLSWNELVIGQNDGFYFNLEVLRKKSKDYQGRDVATQWDDLGSSQIERPTTNVDVASFEIKSLQRVKAVRLVIELIPKAWDLGDSEMPEKWLFVLAEDNLLIAAQPFGEYHNRYPFYILEYELDPFALFNRSMMEVMQPLQHALDWMFNARMRNVRDVINNNIVYDPTRIVAKDVMDPQPGKRIRMRPDAYGTDVRNAIFQLQVSDVTSGHLTDMRVILDMLQRVTGVNDNLMGVVNSGGRKSATEARQSSSFGVNRQKTLCEIWSSQGWDPLAYCILKNTQQHYNDEEQFRIAGDILEGQPAFVRVTPEDIRGAFDFTPVDGTMPIDRYAQANLWREFLQGISQIEPIMMQYDLGGIFGWVARLAGLKNINRFRLDVRPDSDVMGNPNLVPAGNVIPLREDGQAPEPGQVQGIGRTL